MVKPTSPSLLLWLAITLTVVRKPKNDTKSFAHLLIQLIRTNQKLKFKSLQKLKYITITELY